MKHEYSGIVLAFYEKVNDLFCHLFTKYNFKLGRYEYAAKHMDQDYRIWYESETIFMRFIRRNQYEYLELISRMELPVHEEYWHRSEFLLMYLHPDKYNLDVPLIVRDLAVIGDILAISFEDINRLFEKDRYESIRLSLRDLSQKYKSTLPL